MSEIKVEEKKRFLLGFGIIVALCIGIIWSFVSREMFTPESCPTCSVIEEVEKSQKTEESADKEIVYSTFSLPDAYFTFEYPSTWTYEKEESAPGEDYNETFWNFYADADKKQNTITLHYPMYETALDTCLKFETVADYTYSQFATNDPGTFVSYLDCQATAINPEATSSDMGSHIFWQKGALLDNIDISKEIGTEARISWKEGLVDSDVLSHIAHSVKVVE